MIAILLLSISTIIFIIKWYQFNNSIYKRQTNERFFSVLFNKGKHGESGVFIVKNL